MWERWTPESAFAAPGVTSSMAREVALGERPDQISREKVRELQRKNRRESFGRSWYKFSRNPLSVVGGTTILILVLLDRFLPLV